MSNVNLAYLHGTASYSSASTSIISPINSVSFINDNNPSSYFDGSVSYTPPPIGTSVIGVSLRLDITFPASTLVSNVNCIYYWNSSFNHNISLRRTYNGVDYNVGTIAHGANFGWMNDTFNGPFNANSVRITISSNGNTFSGPTSANFSIAEIYVYGQYAPGTGKILYKNGISYNLGEDVYNVSPLLIGNKKIALGNSGDVLATPFRYYDDGTEYTILKSSL